jgi:hypothetical protein
MPGLESDGRLTSFGAEDSIDWIRIDPLRRQKHLPRLDIRPHNALHQHPKAHGCLSIVNMMYLIWRLIVHRLHDIVGPQIRCRIHIFPKTVWLSVKIYHLKEGVSTTDLLRSRLPPNHPATSPGWVMPNRIHARYTAVPDQGTYRIVHRRYARLEACNPRTIWIFPYIKALASRGTLRRFRSHPQARCLLQSYTLHVYAACR